MAAPVGSQLRRGTWQWGLGLAWCCSGGGPGSGGVGACARDSADVGAGAVGFASAGVPCPRVHRLQRSGHIRLRRHCLRIPNHCSPNQTLEVCSTSNPDLL